MRKLMLGILLAAGAAVPTVAVAQTEDHAHEGWQHRAPGAEHGRHENDRPDQPRPEQPRPAPPPAAAPRPQPMAAPPAQAQARVDARGDRGRGGLGADAALRGNNGARFDGSARFQGGDRGRLGGGDPRRFDGANRQPPQGQPPQGQPPQGQAPQGQPQDRGYRGPPVAPGSGGYRAQGGRDGYQGGYRPDAYGRGPGQQYRPGPGNPGQYRQGGGNWTRGWRDDRRYDWHSYRVENRYVFNLPRYYAPRGWGYGYRRFSPGITLFAGLYDQGFWIDDPFYYRLPAAYGPYRWVRYYNDALLVDIRTGYVVDTVYDIFW